MRLLPTDFLGRMSAARYIMTFRRTLDRNISVRRALFLAVVLFTLLIYTAPPFLRWLFSSSYKNTYQFHDDQAAAAVAGTCIDHLLSPHTSALRSRDAVLTLSASSLSTSFSPSDPQHHEHVPLVANGHVALLVPLEGHRFHEPSFPALFIRGTGRTLSLRLPYQPASLAPSIPSSQYSTEYSNQSPSPVIDAEAVLVHYADGYVQHVQCARAPLVTSSARAASSGASLHVAHQFVAHRRRAGLVLQRVSVYNAGRLAVSVPLTGAGAVSGGGGAGWATPLQSHTDSVTVRGESRSYTLYTGVINIQRSQVFLNSSGFVDNTPLSQSAQPMYVAVAIAMSHLPSSVTVGPLSSRSLLLLTSINYTEPRLTAQLASNLLQSRRIGDGVVSTLTSALAENEDQLFSDHYAIWRRHWQTGFSMSHSLADDVINGDLINATLYYVMSQSRAPLHELDTSEHQAEQLRALLSGVEGCYGDKVDTVQARRLWSPLRSLSQVLDTANLWLMLLEKKGCHNLLKAGADGLVQAMVLSMGALKFSNQHLELGLEPKHMHRDYMFRNIQFGNSTFINISVLVNADNRAQLAVSARQFRQADTTSLYACDAGCLDTPVRLGSFWTVLPVKQTEPATSVLYITADWQHALELKHTIHVKEINLAPAHDHGVISMHRHGHTLATVPTLFWLTVFLLIFMFHAFLIKLIANEFCSGSGSAGFSGDSRSVRTRKNSDIK